jgi:hypothetical protein
LSPKSKEVGEIRKPSTPLPLKVKANAWPLMLPEVLPESGPSDGGVNWYVMWQESPGLSVFPWQSWKPPKSPAAPPAMLTTIGAGDTFVTVTDWSGEVPPTATSPKSRSVGVIR